MRSKRSSRGIASALKIKEVRRWAKFHFPCAVLTTSNWISKDFEADSDTPCTAFIPAVSSSECSVQVHPTSIQTHLKACSAGLINPRPVSVHSHCMQHDLGQTMCLSLFFVRNLVTAVLDLPWQWLLSSFMQHQAICQVEPSYGRVTFQLLLNPLSSIFFGALSLCKLLRCLSKILKSHPVADVTL